MLPASALLGALLAAQGVTGTESPQLPPSVEVTHPTMVVAIEAEREPEGDRARYDYTVRYLTTTADGVPIVQLEIGVPGSRDPIREKPLVLEGPPGWTATAIPDGGSPPQTWRISWSCAHSGWDHRMKHQIRPGQVVRGFRAWVPTGASGYATAQYQVFVDPGVGTAGPRWTNGRVSLRRK